VEESLDELYEKWLNKQSEMVGSTN